jgi:hypothetical protein
MIQFAYIITAYKDEKHLYRLISALNVNADFFIHIDSRINIAPFKKILSPFPNVTFCENRHFVNWGSFAQVLSQKELLKCVFETKKEYHKVISLSGTDYPIWSQQKMEAELTKNIEFISGFNLTHCTAKRQRDKINLYHFFRDIKLNNYTLKKAFSGSARLLMSVTPFRKGLRTVIHSTPCDVYFGSDYWALSLDCAKHVYETLNREKEMVRYFKHSFGPSELCIHTIVFNSKFSSKALLFKGREYKGLSSLTPLHHIYYNKTIKIFSEADYQTLIESNKMFFRKAATGISDTLLNKIDRHRLSYLPNLQSNLSN